MKDWDELSVLMRSTAGARRSLLVGAGVGAGCWGCGVQFAGWRVGPAGEDVRKAHNDDRRGEPGSAGLWAAYAASLISTLK